MSVTLPSGMTTIGERAFYGCTNLVSVTLPSSLNYIGSKAFAGCSGLTSIAIDPSNERYYVSGNCLIERATKTLVLGCNSSVIPSGVEIIDFFAFYGMAGLKSIVIPNSVTEIRFQAFAGCTGLTSIILPNGITKIGNDTYSDLSDEVFTDYKEGVYGIKSCDNLRGNVYGGLEYLGSEENPYLYLLRATNGFAGEAIVHENCRFIAPAAFDGCTGLTGITIPSRVTEILLRTFYGCTNLKSITIPDNVTYIGQSAFERCSSLSSVTLGNGLTKIDSEAFNSCTSLTSITIPSSIQYTGSYIFSNCYKLVEIINLSTLNNNKFESTNTLKYKNSGPSDIVSADDYLFYTHNGTNYLLGYVGTEREITLPSDYNGEAYQIYKYAFAYSNITGVNIPDNITTIPEYAFYCCYYLRSITIPQNITSIGTDAFRGCSGLIEVINLSALNIGKNTSNGYVGYYASTIKTSGPSEIDNVNGYLFYTTGGVHYLVGYAGADKALVLPTDYNGEPYAIRERAFGGNRNITSVVISSGVTSIGDSAFSTCYSLTSVTIGNTVTSIGKEAFDGCSKLCTVIFEEGSTLKTIGYCAFYGKDNLKEIIIPDSVTTIGESAFEGCSGLKSVTIGSGVTSRGKYAFYLCESLTSLTIRDGAKVIGEKAFGECKSLPSVVIPSSVETIGVDAFIYCYSLTNITICEGVKILDIGAFSACTSLVSVRIPTSVTELHANAFKGCSSLKSVVYLGTVEQFNAITLYSGWLGGGIPVICSDGVLDHGADPYTGEFNCLEVGLDSHAYSDSYSSDDASHWYACTVCGDKSGESSHVYESGACTVCGHEHAAHEYTSGACSVCGHAHADHAYSNGACSVCGIAHADHSGGSATCEQKAVCEVCGAEYGDFAAHVYQTGTCTVCGHEHADHTYVSGVCSTCDLTHTAHEYSRGVCTVCGLAHTEHTYASGVCSVCGLEHTPHVYSGDVCSVCGYKKPGTEILPVTPGGGGIGGGDDGGDVIVVPITPGGGGGGVIIDPANPGGGTTNKPYLVNKSKISVYHITDVTITFQFDSTVTIAESYSLFVYKNQVLEAVYHKQIPVTSSGDGIPTVGYPVTMESGSTYSFVLCEYNKEFPNSGDSGDVAAYGISHSDGLVMRDGVVIPDGVVDKSKMSLSYISDMGVSIKVEEGSVSLDKEYSLFIFKNQEFESAVYKCTVEKESEKFYFNVNHTFVSGNTYSLVFAEYKDDVIHLSTAADATAYGVSASHGLVIIPGSIVDKSKISVDTISIQGSMIINIDEDVALAEKYTVFIYDMQGTVWAFQGLLVEENTRYFICPNPMSKYETCFVVVSIYREGINYTTDAEIASAYGVSASLGRMTTTH